MITDNEKQVTFIQFDEPPLQAGEYTITLKQKVNLQAEPYTVTRKFAVSGERFVLADEDINSVFPPNLANGEFSGAMAHVVFNRRTLPWERTAVAGQADTPWLAVLLLNKDTELPVQRKTARDLVPKGTAITVQGSTLTGTGEMPAGYISYPGFQTLEYGETPDTPCNVIDIPVALFNQIAPAKEDLPFLAHLRKTDTIAKAGVDASLEDSDYAVTLCNRIPLGGADSYAYLVSLENFGAYLPGTDGTNNIPAGTQYVRLLCYRAWNFFLNNMDQNFRDLLENLNKDQNGLTTLQFPFPGLTPTVEEVQAALAGQAAGTLSSAQADVLVKNAMMMGYIPADHHLRHGGHTVSFYRGPLAPFAVRETVKVPVSTPDALNRYNPQTGMFDVSYSAAWQLGQLLALQNKNYATALYNWKRQETAAEVVAEEEIILREKYKNIKAFSKIFNARKAALSTKAEDDELLKAVTEWLGKLSTLNGVPFNYLLPDTSMLPPESLRFFELNNSWIDAMMDGAFSVGRSTERERMRDQKHITSIFPKARAASCRQRARRPHLLNAGSDAKVVTGFLMRSMLVGGWPGLEINAYKDLDAKEEIPLIRMERLSSEVMIALFDGRLKCLAVHEPPETLHQGVNGTAATGFNTLLRVIKGDNPGQQIGTSTAPIPMRTDNQTIQVKTAAKNILDTLNAPPISEGITTFTSAEFALEMIRSAVKVEFIYDPIKSTT
ncbi:hypothetical protein [Chitinophaga barathri]|uniref:Uncharacterized protein n=1 Tax=Chitinophaga barathri TaxID=1647451 RepID=A0A3N4MLC8_9BACT|nr:hypothetical protein [Chitinophaga barathri]RPD42787.1 hypothetical protein EG028_00365 [Chitinophaga barathri]